MASSYKIHRSTVTGHVPTALDMADHHFAINEADGKLFWLRSSDNTVQSFDLTQSMSAEDIIELLLTVDGSGSGLDADTLDGNDASAFSVIGHSHTGYASSGVQITGGGLATGGGDLGSNRTITVAAASTAEAQAGTATDKAMTPATTKDEILALVLGKTALWIPASAMTSRLTNGPSNGKIELSTNKIVLDTLDFDATTAEYAQFVMRMPKSWNKSTVTFSPVWSHPATTTNFGVVWQLAGVAVPDNTALDAAFGTAQKSTDTGGTTDRAYQGPESSAITIAGTLSADNLPVIFQVSRLPTDGSDTMAVDARLSGIHLYITPSALNDA